MTPYATAIEAWAGVYEVAALASAALAGLLFVTVSLHVDLLAGERAAGIRTMARQTLTNFIVIVVISLIFQIPEATPLSTGVPLVAVGVVGCFEEIRLGLRVRQLSRQELTLIPQNFITMRLRSRPRATASSWPLPWRCSSASPAPCIGTSSRSWRSC